MLQCQENWPTKYPRTMATKMKMIAMRLREPALLAKLLLPLEWLLTVLPIRCLSLVLSLCVGEEGGKDEEGKRGGKGKEKRGGKGEEMRGGNGEETRGKKRREGRGKKRGERKRTERTTVRVV